MKPLHLVPIFILALALPGYASAGGGIFQKADCGCSHAAKGGSKSSSCGCGSSHHHTQKGGHSHKGGGLGCGCGSAHKGGKGHGIVQKGHGIAQKSPSGCKSCGGKSLGGCPSCCLAVIPAVLNGVDHLVTSTVDHVLTTVFACGSCGASSKSKSHGCDCDGSPKVSAPTPPSNPFEDDTLQPPPIPSTEATHRIQRRPIHRRVTQTTANVPVVKAEPRAITISVAKPLVGQSRQPAPVIRTVAGQRPSNGTPYNPLRAK